MKGLILNNKKILKDFSAFNNVRSKTPFDTMNLEKLSSITKKSKLISKIQQLRELTKQYQQETDESKRKELKTLSTSVKLSLPAVSVSGIFRERNKNGIVAPTGYVIIDLDDLEPLELETTKKQLINDKHTLLCFISPSGNGIKAVYSVDLNADELANNWFVAWHTVYNYLTKAYGVKPDESGKDITRLCIISYDEDVYLNLSAEKLKPDYEGTKNSLHNAFVLNASNDNENINHIITSEKKSVFHWYKLNKTNVEAYLLKVINNLYESIVNAPPHQANNTYFKAAITLGKYAHYNAYSLEKIKAYFIEAGTKRGLTPKECHSTFMSGWNTGTTEPKYL